MTATVTTWLDGRIQTVPADDPRLDGIEMVLKGGQMGPPDFFALVAGR